MKVKDLINVFPFADTVKIGEYEYSADKIPNMFMNAVVESARADVSRLSYKHNLVIVTKNTRIQLPEEIKGQMNLSELWR